MKRLIPALAILLIGYVLPANAQQYKGVLDSAAKYYDLKQYKNALHFYEQAISDNNNGNYTYYRASQSACQVGDTEKSITYGKLSFATFADFYNYPYFAADTLNKCFNTSADGKGILAGLQKKYDDWQLQLKLYLEGINDTTKRINNAVLMNDVAVRAIAGKKNAAELTNWIKQFNGYPAPPVKDKWSLYHIKIRDTVNVPFLVYVPKNYDPGKKHLLYVYLHGAAGNRNQFAVKSEVPRFEAEVLKKPLQENAIIIYAFARRDINWLYHQDAFEAIEKEIVFTKARYNIDDNRVYVGGHSDGGRAAFWFAVNKPTNFAAMLGLSYFPSSLIGNTPLSNLKNTTPFYGVNGKQDELFNVDRVSDIWKYAQENGANWQNFFMEGTHSLPVDAPDATFFVYDKLFAQTRNPFPKKIAWETDNVKNGRNSWIAITALDTLAEKQDWHKVLNPPYNQNGVAGKANFNKNKSGAVIATADGNTINILTSRVKSIRLYISADMFDLSKQLKVRINNEDFLNIQLSAEKEVILDEFLKTKDRAFIVASKMELTIR